MAEMTRKFILRNSLGQEIDFLDTSNLDYFGHEPEGLGADINGTFYNSGANFLLDLYELNQNEFKLEAVMGYVSSESYKLYYDLVRMLNHPPYDLIYETAIGTWSRKCMLKTIEKSEVNTEDLMMEDIKFYCTTPWFRDASGTNPKPAEIEGVGKIYLYPTDAGTPEEPGEEIDPTKFDLIYNRNMDFPYTYPKVTDGDDGGSGEEEVEESKYAYIYDYIYDPWREYGEQNFMIDNESVYLGVAKGSPCEIVIRGPAINPRWEVVQDGNIVQSDGFELTVDVGYTLVVSSVPQELSARLIGPDGQSSNVYAQQLLEYTNFVTIPMGECAIVFFNCEDVTFTYREERVTL